MLLHERGRRVAQWTGAQAMDLLALLGGHDEPKASVRSLPHVDVAPKDDAKARDDAERKRNKRAQGTTRLQRWQQSQDTVVVFEMALMQLLQAHGTTPANELYAIVGKGLTATGWNLDGVEEDDIIAIRDEVCASARARSDHLKTAETVQQAYTGLVNDLFPSLRRSAPPSETLLEFRRRVHCCMLTPYMEELHSRVSVENAQLRATIEMQAGELQGRPILRRMMEPSALTGKASFTSEAKSATVRWVHKMGSNCARAATVWDATLELLFIDDVQRRVLQDQGLQLMAETTLRRAEKEEDEYARRDTQKMVCEAKAFTFLWDAKKMQGGANLGAGAMYTWSHPEIPVVAVTVPPVSVREIAVYAPAGALRASTKVPSAAKPDTILAKPRSDAMMSATARSKKVLAPIAPPLERQEAALSTPRAEQTGTGARGAGVGGAGVGEASHGAPRRMACPARTGRQVDWHALRQSQAAGRIDAESFLTDYNLVNVVVEMVRVCQHDGGGAAFRLLRAHDELIVGDPQLAEELGPNVDVILTRDLHLHHPLPYGGDMGILSKLRNKETRRAALGLNYMRIRYSLLPVSHDQLHWTIVLVDKIRRRVFLWDPIGEDYYELRLAIDEVVHDLFSVEDDWSPSGTIALRLQTDGKNCGVWLLWLAKVILNAIRRNTAVPVTPDELVAAWNAQPTGPRGPPPPGVLRDLVRICSIADREVAKQPNESVIGWFRSECDALLLAAVQSRTLAFGLGEEVPGEAFEYDELPNGMIEIDNDDANTHCRSHAAAVGHTGAAEPEQEASGDDAAMETQHGGGRGPSGAAEGESTCAHPQREWVGNEMVHREYIGANVLSGAAATDIAQSMTQNLQFSDADLEYLLVIVSDGPNTITGRFNGAIVLVRRELGKPLLMHIICFCHIAHSVFKAACKAVMPKHPFRQRSADNFVLAFMLEELCDLVRAFPDVLQCVRARAEEFVPKPGAGSEVRWLFYIDASAYLVAQPGLAQEFAEAVVRICGDGEIAKLSHKQAALVAALTDPHTVLWAHLVADFGEVIGRPLLLWAQQKRGLRATEMESYLAHIRRVGDSIRAQGLAHDAFAKTRKFLEEDLDGMAAAYNLTPENLEALRDLARDGVAKMVDGAMKKLAKRAADWDKNPAHQTAGLLAVPHEADPDQDRARKRAASMVAEGRVALQKRAAACFELSHEALLEAAGADTYNSVIKVYTEDELWEGVQEFANTSPGTTLWTGKLTERMRRLRNFLFPIWGITSVQSEFMEVGVKYLDNLDPQQRVNMDCASRLLRMRHNDLSHLPLMSDVHRWQISAPVEKGGIGTGQRPKKQERVVERTQDEKLTEAVFGFGKDFRKKEADPSLGRGEDKPSRNKARADHLADAAEKNRVGKTPTERKAARQRAAAKATRIYNEKPPPKLERSSSAPRGRRTTAAARTRQGRSASVDSAAANLMDVERGGASAATAAGAGAANTEAAAALAAGAARRDRSSRSRSPQRDDGGRAPRSRSPSPRRRSPSGPQRQSSRLSGRPV